MIIAIGTDDEIDLLIGGILAESLRETEERILGSRGDDGGGEDGGRSRGTHDLRFEVFETGASGGDGWGGGGRRHGGDEGYYSIIKSVGTVVIAKTVINQVRNPRLEAKQRRLA